MKCKPHTEGHLTISDDGFMKWCGLPIGQLITGGLFVPYVKPAVMKAQGVNTLPALDLSQLVAFSENHCV